MFIIIDIWRHWFSFSGVYDWLGANFKIPLFFILVHQATNNMVDAEQNVETERHVLRVIKKVDIIDF